MTYSTINEDLVKDLAKNLGLDGFELYPVQDFKGTQVYLRTSEPFLVTGADIAAGNYLTPLAAQLQALMNNTKYVQRFKKELEAENESLKAQVRELEKYKTHFDLEKEKLQAGSTDISTEEVG